MKISKEHLTTMVKEAIDNLTPEEQQLIQESQALTEEKAKLNRKKYGKVYHRLDRLLKLTKCDAPSIILANELRMLCELFSTVHPEIESQVDYAGLHSEGEV